VIAQTIRRAKEELDDIYRVLHFDALGDDVLVLNQVSQSLGMPRRSRRRRMRGCGGVDGSECGLAPGGVQPAPAVLRAALLER